MNQKHEKFTDDKKKALESIKKKRNNFFITIFRGWESEKCAEQSGTDRNREKIFAASQKSLDKSKLPTTNNR